MPVIDRYQSRAKWEKTSPVSFFGIFVAKSRVRVPTNAQTFSALLIRIRMPNPLGFGRCLVSCLLLKALKYSNSREFEAMGS